MELPKPKIKPKLKIADEALDLKHSETNVVIEQIEETMRLRELPIEKHAFRKLKRPNAQD